MVMVRTLWVSKPGSTDSSLRNVRINKAGPITRISASAISLTTSAERRPGNLWFDQSTFSQEPIGTFGNVKRNFFHGPGFNYSNFETYKNIPVGGLESPRSVQLRPEAYNAFNHANFANPNGNYGAGSLFGNINSVDQPVNTGADPQPGRAIQLAGKFYF